MTSPWPVAGGEACTALLNLLANEGTFAMHKMEISVSGQQRIFLFRGPGCRKAMLEWWRDHFRRAKAGEDIRNIHVWGTVGNKTDIVLEGHTHGPSTAEEHNPGSARGLDAGQQGSRAQNAAWLAASLAGRDEVVTLCKPERRLVAYRDGPVNLYSPSGRVLTAVKGRPMKRARAD